VVLNDVASGAVVNHVHDGFGPCLGRRAVVSRQSSRSRVSLWGPGGLNEQASDEG
jgi:hypothetical protein